MITESLTLDGAFEVAHALPDRVRLRWRGSGDPAPAFLEQLRLLPGVARVDYRKTSRSVLVYGNGAAPQGSPRPAAGRELASLPRPGSDVPLPRRVSGAAAVLAAGVDVDALLTAGLVATWLADLFTSRAIRLITLPLLVLAGITGYRLYERRQAIAESDVADAAELMLLTG